MTGADRGRFVGPRLGEVAERLESAQERLVESATAVLGPDLDCGWLGELLVRVVRLGGRLDEDDRAIAMAGVAAWARSWAERDAVRQSIHEIATAARVELDVFAAERELPLGAVMEATHALADFEFAALGCAEAAMTDLHTDRSKELRWDLIRRVLVHGLGTGPASAARRRAATRENLTGAIHVVVLTDAAQADPLDSVVDRARQCVAAAGSDVVGPIPVALPLTDSEVAVLLVGKATASRVEGLVAALEEPCQDLHLVAVHAGSEHLGGLQPTFRGLEQSVRIAGTCTHRFGRVMAADDLLDHLAVSRLDRAVQETVAFFTLGPFMADPPEMLPTLLDALWLWSGGYSARDIAPLVNRNENTVYTYLQAFEEATGLDRDRDRRRIRFALCVLDLLGPSLPAPGDPWWRTGPRG